ncbi:MAG: ATP-dependent zinc metalloprotease FtsH [Clostridium sp.]
MAKKTTNDNKNKNKKNENNSPKKIPVIVIYLVLAFSMISAFNYTLDKATTKEITYNEFLNYVEEDKIEKIRFTSDTIYLTPKEGAVDEKKQLYTGYMYNEELIPFLREKNVSFTKTILKENFLMEFLLTWILPFGFIFLMFSFVTKKMGKGGGMMNMGKSDAKIYVENEIGITFKDVAGQDEAKESLKEIIDFLNKPQKYTEIGAKLPKGALLVGPPGTGKTLLAKAVAGEAKVPFFSISGSNFVEMFVGMGAAKVRDLFKEADKIAPCIIFIDEIDSIGKSRDGQLQTNEEREQTLNQLLTQMDGFDPNKGIVILGATNRPEILDKALLRPGRFDRRVIVDRPDLKGRIDILKVHVKNVKLDETVDLEKVAKGTPGAVGADLANMVNEAALRAVRLRRELVSQEDFNEAIEVIIAGKEKKDRILSKKEKKTVAYHEVGHALIAALLGEDTDPVHKITIVPRTMGALGYTMQLPEEEKYLVSKEELMGQIKVLLGGRAAEEVEFNQLSTGASNDIERATQTARSMVTVYGMTDEFDMMALESVKNRYLDARSVRECSEQTSTLVDNAILQIIKDCHKEAKDLLTENKDLLDEISKYLLEKETIYGEEFMAFVVAKHPHLEKKKKSDKEVAVDVVIDEQIALEENTLSEEVVVEEDNTLSDEVTSDKVNDVEEAVKTEEGNIE